MHLKRYINAWHILTHVIYRTIDCVSCDSHGYLHLYVWSYIKNNNVGHPIPTGLNQHTTESYTCTNDVVPLYRRIHRPLNNYMFLISAINDIIEYVFHIHHLLSPIACSFFFPKAILSIPFSPPRSEYFSDAHALISWFDSAYAFRFN